jgi:hypothetical protein
VPDPRSLVRLVALAGFLLLVAVGLWLLDAAWPVIIGVMPAAWAVAAVVEWASWRLGRYGHVVAERQLPSVEASVAEPAAELAPEALTPPEPEAPLLPPLEEEAAPLPPKSEPVKGPLSEPPVDEAKREAGEPVQLRAAPPERPPLRPVPQPPPQPPPRPAPPPAAARATVTPGVVDLRRRATTQARRWNLWDLERLAHEELQDDPQRSQELSYLFVHLRQFASADGSLPTEFDPLVRESLGDLLEPRR